MRKIFTLLCLSICIFAKANFAVSLTYLTSFSVHQIDSILAPQHIPSYIINPLYAVNLYRVTYNTVSWDSTPTTASGLLCIPVGTPCKSAIVSYQHGTLLQKNSAPSFLVGDEWTIALIGASLGYDAMEPDYLGMGTGPGFHPYQVAHPEATSTIDMIRAAKEILDTTSAPYSDQLFLMGYSQGGHATMATHQLIQETPYLDSVMHVTASAPMSGAYDLSGVMGDVLTSSNPYPAPFYLPYLIFGYNEVYHSFANDSDVMIAPYDTTLRPLFYNGVATEGDIDNAMPQSGVPSQIMRPFQIDSFVNDSTTNFFRDTLKANNTYYWLPKSPMNLYFCTGDHYVSHDNTTVAFNYFKHLSDSLGQPLLVDTFDMGPSEHQDCAPYAILNAVKFFQALTYQPIKSHGVAVTNNTSSTMPNGTAVAYDTLGEPPYTYSWSTGATSASISGLDSGTYYVSVTDRNGCNIAVDSALVKGLTINGIPQEDLLTNVRIFPNPSKGVIYVQSMDPTENLKQPEVFDMNGRLVKTYAVTQGNMIQLYFDQAAQGVYCVLVQDYAGKQLRTKITILE